MTPATKRQVKGKLRELKGKAEEKAGQIGNDPQLAKRGKTERLAGKVQKEAAQDDKVLERLREAAVVFSKVMAAPDKGIPHELLDNAYSIVIVPGLKSAAFGFGGKYGKGFISCRNKNGVGWSAPGNVRIEGLSVGFQIGGSETDLIMLIMNEHGADKLLSNEFTLGAEGSVAAGPVGRTATAQTDAQMGAEILSWSRSQGLFAGFALEGATLRQDLDDNISLYGKKMENRAIVTEGLSAPEPADKLIALLDRFSPLRPGAKGEKQATSGKAAVRKTVRAKSGTARKQTSKRKARTA